MWDDHLGIHDDVCGRIFTDFTVGRFEYRELQVLLHGERWKMHGGDLHRVELDCFSRVAVGFLLVVTYQRLVC